MRPPWRPSSLVPATDVFIIPLIQLFFYEDHIMDLATIYFSLFALAPPRLLAGGFGVAAPHLALRESTA